MRSRGLGKCGLVSLAIAERARGASEEAREREQQANDEAREREREPRGRRVLTLFRLRRPPTPAPSIPRKPSRRVMRAILATPARISPSHHGPRSRRARERESQGVANLFGAYNCVYMFIGTHRPRHATEYRHSCTERTAALSRQSLALVLMCAPVALRATRPLVAPWLVSSSRSTA